MRRIFRNLFARSNSNQTNTIRRRPAHDRTRLSMLRMEDRVVPATFLVTSSADGAVAAPGDLPGSLRQAIFDSNANADNDIIEFSFASPTTITLTSGQLLVTEDSGAAAKTVAFMNGAGKGAITIDGNNLDGILAVDTLYTGATFDMSDMTLTKGNTLGDGGGLKNLSVATVSTLTNVNITNCIATNAFGGGATFAGVATLTNCTITGNQVNTTLGNAIGGGVDFDSTATLIGCTITGNKVISTVGHGYGAGVAGSVTATLTVTNCNISGNTSTVSAAAKYSYGVNIIATGGLTMTGSTVNSGSTAATKGFGVGVYANGILNISNSTLSGNSGGQLGGAIYAGGTDITISNCIINTNSVSNAGAVMWWGNVAATKMIMTDCSLEGNTGTGAGGALRRASVLAGDTILIDRCTFIGNGSGNSGGVFASSGAGSGVVQFRNSTFFQNAAAANGGIIRTFGSFAGTIDLRNCTVVGTVTSGIGSVNVGGLAGGKLNIESSVFSKNKAGGTEKSANADVQSLTTNTNTITNSYIAVGFPAGFVVTESGNTKGTAAAPIDPQLETTPANHGGTTKTLLPLSGASPLINKGSDSSGLLTTDQRNDSVTFPRSFSGGIDIGAVEFNNPVPAVTKVVALDVTTTGPTTHTFDITFASTVNQINASTLSAAGAVTVSGGAFGSPVNATLIGGPYVDAASITATFQITAPGGTWDFADNGTYTISIAANKVFDKTAIPLPVSAGAVGTFKGAIGASIIVDTFSLDEASDTDGKTSLREALLKANSVAFSGKDTITFDAAVFTGTDTIALDPTTLKTLTVGDSVVIIGPAGRAVIDAGFAARAMVVTGVGTLDVSISNLNFVNGLQADLAFGSNGGAVRIDDENVTFTNCDFSDNTNALEGGAVGQTGLGNLVFNNSKFVNNKTTNNGGGAIGMVGGGTLTLNNSTIESNSATGGGGAIFAPNLTSMAITGSTIGGVGKGNTGTGNGGGINATGVITMTVTNSSFIENSSSGAGIVAAGAIFINGTTNLTITGSSFVGNNGSDAGTGSVAGALGILGTPTVSIDTSTFKGNFTASGNGGAIWSRDDANPTITITNSTISGNTAGGAITTGSGGGISMNGGGKLTITNTTIANNSAATDGGGIDAVGDPTALPTPIPIVVAIRNSTIAFNTAAAGAVGGGGIAMHTIAGGSLTLSSTIVAKNINAVSADVNADAPLVATSTNNFIGDTTGSVVTYSAAVLSGDPLFAVAGLTNNGGPTETIAIQAASTAKNAGNNALGLSFDQRGSTFFRSTGTGTDIGAFEFQDPFSAAKVTAITINSTKTGAEQTQRSRVFDVAITFDSPVTFLTTAGNAFTLTKVGGGSVTLSGAVSGGGTIVTLTFTGGSVDNVSLADGRYNLVALASQFTGGGIDGTGPGDATAGDDYNFLQTTVAPTAVDPTRIFRIFGDFTGDGSVAANDFIQFRLALGGSSPIFDLDNDGAVAASDFIGFRIRFGGSI